MDGNTTAMMLTRWTNTYRITNPTYLCLLGGINDVIGDIPAATIEGNLQTMYDQANADGVRVVPMTIGPFKNNASWTAGRQTNLDTVNTWIRSYAASKGWRVVDTYTGMGDGAGALAASYDSGDGLHPNATGYAALANLVKPALGF